MGKPQRKKGTPSKNKEFNKGLKTKRFSKMDDQIYEELNNENKMKKLIHQEINDQLPGLGQYYCVACAKYFINEKTQKEHYTLKTHKRQVKKLKEKPYDIKEAELYSK